MKQFSGQNTQGGRVNLAFVPICSDGRQKLLDNYITMYVYHPAELHGSEEIGDKLFLFFKTERFFLNSDLPIIILETRLQIR